MQSQQSPKQELKTTEPQQFTNIEIVPEILDSDSDSDYIPPTLSPSHHSSALSELTDESITINTESSWSTLDTYDYNDKFIEDTRKIIDQNDIDHLVFCDIVTDCKLCEFYRLKYDIKNTE